MKKKALLFSILTIAACLCIIAGSTFALFSSSTTVNVAVTAANVEVVASIDSAMKTWSLNDTTYRTDKTFTNGGSVGIVENTNSQKLEIVRMTPGDNLEFVIKVENKSNVALQYRLHAVSELLANTPKDLTEALVITAKVDGVDYPVTGTENISAWIPAPLNNGEAGAITDIVVTIEFPNGTEAHDNEFKKAGAAITFTVEAVQGNGVDANGDLILP
jgi:predicted ribosomally synthesized peptide with SipW-like signal peptide